jgi:hypothetical protein
VHRITATLQIGSEHGQLTLTGFPPDIAAGLGRPIISGAAPISGFAPTPNLPTSPILKAMAPSGVAKSSVLFVEERPGWLQRARMPKKSGAAPAERARGYDDLSTFHWAAPLAAPASKSAPFPAVDKLGFVYNASSSPEITSTFHALDEIQVLHFHSWTAFWSNLSTVHPENSTLLFSAPSITAIGQYAVQGGRRFVLENVLEGLDEPEEWYWDSTTNSVSVYPWEGVNAATLTVLAPQMIQLLSLTDAADVTVIDVEFRHGGCGHRVNTYFAPFNDAAIVLQRSTRIRFERVSISDSGSLGFSLMPNVTDVTIVNCSATNLGGDGIFIGQPTGVKNIVVTNSVINNTALVYMGQPAGITFKGESNISATHNTVGFSPYAGIKVGWQTGTDAAHGAIGVAEPIFRVEYNKVSVGSSSPNSPNTHPPHPPTHTHTHTHTSSNLSGAAVLD